MKNILQWLFFLGLIHIGNSQELFLEIPNDLKQDEKQVRQVFTIVNKKNNDFAIFLGDKKSLNGYLIDKDKKLKGKIASSELPSKYATIVGYSIKGNNYHLILKNSTGKKFGVINYNFDNRTSTEKELDFKLKGELLFQTHSTVDKLYLFTVVSNSSDLKLYSISYDGTYETKDIPLKNVFRKKDGTQISLYDFVKVSKIQKIIKGNPISVEDASERIKMYIDNDIINLSIDINNLFTYLVTIDITNDLTDFKLFNKPKLKVKDDHKVTNSFIYDDKLFLIGSNAQNLKLQIKDIKDLTLIKELNINKDDKEIAFTNSPIRVEVGARKSKELNKTSQFLRRISRKFNGVAVNKSENGYKLTIGGKTAIPNGTSATGVAFGLGFGAVGGIAFALAISPTYSAYNSYSSSISTRIECLFDQNFNHVLGEVAPNVFDDIKDYKKRLPKTDYALGVLGGDRTETVFRYNEYYMLGMYNHTTNTLELTNF